MNYLILTLLLVVGNMCHLSSAAWLQPPTDFGPLTNSMTGATDGNGNAVAAWAGEASYYSNGAWGPVQSIDPTGGVPHVAMDASGNALLVYGSVDATEFRTAYLNGGIWTVPPPNPLDTVFFTSRSAVAMNGSGGGVAVWNNFDFVNSTGAVRSSFFSGGSWSPPITIATGINPTPNSIAYSANGDAVTIWADFGDFTIHAANYIGGVWQPEVTLGSSFGLGFPVVSIDASGNPIAAWINASGDVIAATYDGVSWSPTTLAAGPGNLGMFLAMAPGGTAVLTWQDNAGNGFSRSFNGTVWEPTLQFGSSLPTGFNIGAGVSVDNVGNALVVFYSSSTNQVLSSSLPLGGNWAPPLIIKDASTETTINTPYVSAISPNGGGFAFWTEEIIDLETAIVFASVLVGDQIIGPPAGISGRSCTNKFATQKTYTHIINWLPSPDPTVLSYYIRRNGVLAAIIPSSGPYSYIDGNCSRTTDLYTLTAVNGFGDESTPLNIVLN